MTMKKILHLKMMAQLIVGLLLVPNFVFSQTEESLEKSFSQLVASHGNFKIPYNPKPLWVTKNPFERRVFVENKGQFDSENNIPENKIKYGVREGGTFVYFSTKGLLYRHDEYPVITEEQKEKLEDLKGKRLERMFEKLKVKTTIVNVEWEGANPNTTIESEDKVFDYFCYGSIKANGFKKITYKNIYPKIDLEYTMKPAEEGGMKYVIILHPGADASLIKMKYTNADKVKLTEAGDIVLKSKIGDITDHAPKTFYEGGVAITSNFVLNENTVTFQLTNYDHSQTVIIDPTISFPGTPAKPASGFNLAVAAGATGRSAYDVDYDYAGNVYVFGGVVPYCVVKLNSAGTVLWSYNLGKHFGAALFSIGAGTAYGDFTVDPNSQSVYFCEGFAIGTSPCRVGKIGPKGDSIATNSSATAFNEMWRMAFNACVGKAVIAGASNAQAQGGPYHMAIVDTTMASVAAVDVLGDDRDMAILAMDDFGDAFGACSKLGGGTGGTANTMARMPLASNFAPTWKFPSQHDHAEFTATSYVQGNTGGYNGMAVTNKFLYTYDGTQLRKWDKAGTLLKTVNVRTGSPDFKCGGIAADNDDNVYVGVQKNVVSYDANLALITTTAAPDSVYDIKLSKNNLLYVSGAAFVTTFPAIPSSSNFTASIIPTNSCGGSGSAEAVVTTGVPPYTYKWSTSPAQTTAIATNLAPGTYTLTVVDASCAKAITTQTVTITSGAAVPVAVNSAINSSATICEGSTLNLTATGATTYSWLPTIGLNNPTAATVVASPTVTTTYTVTGTVGGCTGTTTFAVIVNPLPLVKVNSQDICTGQSATLNASGATSYTWTPATNLSSTTAATVTANPTSPINYTVTGTTNGCTNSAVSAVTISVMPSSNAGADITICSGTIGNIGAPATVGYVYIWSPATGLSSSTGANPSITLSNNGTTPVTSSYTVTTSPAGCSSTDVVNITVNPMEDTTFNYTRSTFCPPGTETPIIGSTGGVFSASPATGLNINTSTGAVDLAASTKGTYIITYTTQTLCWNATSVNLTITSSPDASFNYAGPYCQNVINPTPTFPLGSSAGIFSSAAGLVFANTATGEINLKGSTAGVYTVTNTIAAGGGCPQDIKTNTITINAIPVVTVDSKTVCAGTPTTLTASGASNYTWSNGSLVNTMTDNPLTATSYTVTGTTAGCSAFAIGSITTVATPTVTITSPKDTICVGDTLNLTANGALTYSWSTGQTLKKITVKPANTATYSVTGASSICNSIVKKTITVNPLPTITVNSPVICQGLNAVLTASGGGSYVWSDTTFVQPKTVSPQTTTTYSVYGSTANCSGIPSSNMNAFFTCWIGGCINGAVSTVTVTQKPVITVNSPTICSGKTALLTATGGATLTWMPGGTSGNTLSVTPLTTATYTVSDNTPNCSATATATVTVTIPPVVTVNAATICAGQSGTLTATGNSGSYSWSNGSVSGSITDNPATTKSYTVTGNPGGCSTSKVTTITVNKLPIISVNDVTVCEGTSATLTASGGVSYVWSNGSQTAANIVTPNKTSSYTVTGSNTANCSVSTISNVTVFPKPIAEFSFNPNPAGVLNPVIAFTDKSSSSVNYWHWDFGDGDTLSPNVKNPVHTYPPVETSYVVTLNVLNAGLCPSSISHDIVIGPEFTFYMPNTFTPNNDKLNDVFGAKGGGIITFQMLIFDRWGNLIFTGDDISKTWDGKVNGKDGIIQQDTYIWKVKLTDILKKNHEYIGTVTISNGE
jgi:gliding motility-associated-like protein